MQKNELYTLSSFGDIKVKKILQSDWQRTFWPLN